MEMYSYHIREFLAERLILHDFQFFFFMKDKILSFSILLSKNYMEIELTQI